MNIGETLYWKFSIQMITHSNFQLMPRSTTSSPSIAQSFPKEIEPFLETIINQFFLQVHLHPADAWSNCCQDCFLSIQYTLKKRRMWKKLTYFAKQFLYTLMSKHRVEITSLSGPTILCSIHHGKTETKDYICRYRAHRRCLIGLQAREIQYMLENHYLESWWVEICELCALKKMKIWIWSSLLKE